ncbi:MAG: sulfite exporter TauE/SafE family protein, partial [Holophagales bacterium]|nr:sulfite exporter TauE/SafE family protein [Holophagales bacterium]
MTRLKTLLAALSFFLCLPALAGSFDPEKDVSVSFKGGSVIIELPRAVHANELSVDLKAGSLGKINVGPLPPHDGFDSLGAKYWKSAIRIPVKGEGLKDPVTLIVTYMTCMEGEGGLCFPPVDKELKVRAAEIPGGAPAVTELKSSETAPTNPADAKPAQTNPVSNLSPSAAPEAKGDGVITAANGDEGPSPNADSPPAPPSTSGSGLLKLLILFFLGGIGASLTPCVLPMIPITMAVIGARSASKARGLLLGIVLTQGMALTYTVLGVIAALTGSVFGQFAQQPGFLIPVSLIFAIFAISLLGAFEIRLPDSITSKLQAGAPRNGLAGAFVTGLILGPLSAPCVGPLIGAAILDIGMNRQVF